jgi:hypothetical protein
MEGHHRRDGGWIKPHDANQNGVLESDEFQAAVERTFTEFDRNKNGVIEPGEAGPPPRPEPGREHGRDGKRLLPPFFFDEQMRSEKSISRQEFQNAARSVFTEMDKNSDGTLTMDESRPARGPMGPPPPDRPGAPPNARFIAAELRFGDKLVQNAPFSAETVIEDTRRLFDGTTVTKQSRGAIYRDSEGRTRREQPLEMVGGFSVVGSDEKPQTLIFINDFVKRSQIFLDLSGKVARVRDLGDGRGPREPGEPAEAKTESLGTKTIEGIKAEGTRITREIPVGSIGNDKPIAVVTERWFSPELQVLVMSRHLDPIAGEHVFRLVNIKRSDPAPELFTVPSGFTLDDQPGLAPRPR